jgi:DNA-binding response OmpR family regulator
VKQPEDIANAEAPSPIDATARRASMPADLCDRAQDFRCADGDDAAAPLTMVLLIDDDSGFRTELSRYVRSNGFDTLESDSFAAAAEFVQAYDGVCVVVPELTVGSRHLFDYLAEIKRGPHAAVLVLSSRREKTEKIIALELGADDFIAKTADQREILARIRAAARRLLARQCSEGQPEAVAPHAVAAAAGSWRFLRTRRELIDPDGLPVRLTTAEFSLLDAFVASTGRPLSRDHLTAVALGRHSYANDRGIDNLVAKLRRKLRDSARLGRMIKTARPGGYVFTGFSTAAAARGVAPPQHQCRHLTKSRHAAK